MLCALPASRSVGNVTRYVYATLVFANHTSACGCTAGSSRPPSVGTLPRGRPGGRPRRCAGRDLHARREDHPVGEPHLVVREAAVAVHRPCPVFALGGQVEGPGGEGCPGDPFDGVGGGIAVYGRAPLGDEIVQLFSSTKKSCQLKNIRKRYVLEVFLRAVVDRIPHALPGLRQATWSPGAVTSVTRVGGADRVGRVVGASVGPSVGRRVTVGRDVGAAVVGAAVGWNVGVPTRTRRSTRRCRAGGWGCPFEIIAI